MDSDLVRSQYIAGDGIFLPPPPITLSSLAPSAKPLRAYMRGAHPPVLDVHGEGLRLPCFRAPSLLCRTFQLSANPEDLYDCNALLLTLVVSVVPSHYRRCREAYHNGATASSLRPPFHKGECPTRTPCSRSRATAEPSRPLGGAADITEFLHRAFERTAFWDSRTPRPGGARSKKKKHCSSIMIRDYSVFTCIPPYS